jgi:hypothetical protein
LPSPDAPVLVLVSVDPETSHRENEAVRIALGIVAGENEVVLALLGPAVKVLGAEVEDCVDGEDTLRHVATLKRLGQVFHVERSAIPARGDWNAAGVEVVPVDGAGLADLIAASRRVLAF